MSLTTIFVLHDVSCLPHTTTDCRENAARGLCSLELYLLAPYTVAHATLQHIKNATESVFVKCAVGPYAPVPGMGGIATQTGTSSVSDRNIVGEPRNKLLIMMMRVGGDDCLAVVMKQHSFPRVVRENVPGWHVTESNVRKMLAACRSIVN